GAVNLHAIEVYYPSFSDYIAEAVASDIPPMVYLRALDVIKNRSQVRRIEALFSETFTGPYGGWRKEVEGLEIFRAFGLLKSDMSQWECEIGSDLDRLLDRDDVRESAVASLADLADAQHQCATLISEIIHE